MSDSRVGRAIVIVRESVYADPLLEEVTLVKQVLRQDLNKEERLVLLAVALRIPVKILKAYHSTWTTTVLKRAAIKFIEALERNLDEETTHEV